MICSSELRERMLQGSKHCDSHRQQIGGSDIWTLQPSNKNDRTRRSRRQDDWILGCQCQRIPKTSKSDVLPRCEPRIPWSRDKMRLTSALQRRLPSATNQPGGGEYNFISFWYQLAHSNVFHEIVYRLSNTITLEELLPFDPFTDALMFILSQFWTLCQKCVDTHCTDFKWSYGRK